MPVPTRTVDRRRLLRWLAVGPAALSLALREQLALADGLKLEQLAQAPRELSLRNLHTDERLQVCYFQDGHYQPAALAQLHQLLRDHRSGEVATIDPKLFDQLHVLAAGAGTAPRYEIISGYRSPASNAKLHAQSSGVASRSLHMEGRAMDVRLGGVSCSRLRDLAIAQRLGGVGYYKASNFVHVDTGRVRTWTG
jgi:uncharacterized protein YcbK (DUF882 family)